MNLNWKKIGLIFTLIGALIVFAFLVYYFFFRPIISPPIEEAEPETETKEQLPTTQNETQRRYIIDPDGNLVPMEDAEEEIEAGFQPIATVELPVKKTISISDGPSQYFNINKNGQSVFYNPDEGKFFQLMPDGSKIALSNKTFYGVNEVVWANNSLQAILNYPDGSNILYDFKDNEQTTLPQHWQDFSFSPTDNEIVFKSIALDTENRFLTIAKADGSQARTIERIGGVENQFQVSWSPNNQVIATFTEGKDLNRSEVYFIGQNKENFKSMIVNGRGFEGIWSPEGDKIFYSVYNSNDGYTPQLWVSDARPGEIGNNRKSIGLRTWAKKCTFANNEKIFCSVPTQIPYGAGLDKSSTNNIADQIYEINLNTGTKKIISTFEEDYTINNLIYNELDQSLYFQINDDDNTYKINTLD